MVLFKNATHKICVYPNKYPQCDTKDRLLCLKNISECTKKSIKNPSPSVAHQSTHNLCYQPRSFLQNVSLHNTQGAYAIAAAMLSFSKAAEAAFHFISPAYSEKSFT